MGLVFVLAGKMHKIEGSPVTMGGRVVGRSQSQPPKAFPFRSGRRLVRASLCLFHFHLFLPGNQNRLYGSMRLITHGDFVTDRWFVLRRFDCQGVLARGYIIEVIHTVKAGKGGGGVLLNGVNEGDLDMGSRRGGSRRPLIIKPPFHIATVGKTCHNQKAC